MEGFDDLFDVQFLDNVWQPMINNDINRSTIGGSTGIGNSVSGTNNNNMVFDMDDLMDGDFLDNTMLENPNTMNSLQNNFNTTNISNNIFNNTVNAPIRSGETSSSTSSSSLHNPTSNSLNFMQSTSPNNFSFGSQPTTMNSINTSQNNPSVSPFSTQFLSSPVSNSSASLVLGNNNSSISNNTNSNNNQPIQYSSVSRSNVFALNVLPMANFAQHQVGAAIINNNSTINPTATASSTAGSLLPNAGGISNTINDNDLDDNDLDDEDLDDDYFNDPKDGNKSGPENATNNKYSNSKTLTMEERRLKRLERNRESARQSRQRKKQYLALLEGRVVALQQQIYELRSSHASSAYQMLEEQRQRLLYSLESLAYKDTLTPEEEASLQDAAIQLVDRFGPDCAERRAVREFHFDQLHRLLLPPHTKFLLWLIHQPNDFFVVNNIPIPSSTPNNNDNNGSNKTKGSANDKNKKNTNDYDINNLSNNNNNDRPSITLWTLLCAEIGLANDQAERFRTQLRRVLGGPDLPRETWRLGVAAAYLQRLRVGIAASAAKAQSHLEKVGEILTPSQLIRYLAWMERNKDRVSKAIEQTVVSPVNPGINMNNNGNPVVNNINTSNNLSSMETS